MGFVSGPVSLQRFAINSKFFEQADDAFVARLKKRAFARSAPLADDTQLGWIGPRHLFDDDLDAGAITYGSYVFLGIRLDRLRAPGGVIKAYVRLEEQALLKAGGRDFLSKGEKRKAREAAVERAEREARNGDFRRMGMVPVLVDLKHRVAYLGHTSAAMADKFIALFRDTFDVSPEPLLPAAIAERILKAAKNLRALEHLTPLQLVRAPSGSEGGALPDAGFLGRELLTWLWYRIQQDEGQLRVQGGDDIAVLIERTLRLKCIFGATGTTTISAESPAGLPEAHAALRSGKLPHKAGLILGSRVGEFRLTFDGGRFSISSMTVPDGEPQANFAARLEQRFEFITDAGAILDALFDLFLQERVGHEWNALQRAMSAWAKGEGAAKRAAAV